MNGNRAAFQLRAWPKNKPHGINGSGFLAELYGTTSLVTCAHLGCAPDRPTAAWDIWSQTLGIVLGDDLAKFPLFFGGEPEFGYALARTNGNDLHDALWLDLQNLHPKIRAYLQDNYDAFDLNDVVEFPTGTALTAYGYPDGGIRRDPDAIRGKVRESVIHQIVADMDTASGFSGGPVVDDDANLAGISLGMIIPNAPNPTGILPAEVLAHFIWSWRIGGPGAQFPYGTRPATLDFFGS